jgi:hypothetical protein
VIYLVESFLRRSDDFRLVHDSIFCVGSDLVVTGRSWMTGNRGSLSFSFFREFEASDVGGDRDGRTTREIGGSR